MCSSGDKSKQEIKKIVMGIDFLLEDMHKIVDVAKITIIIIIILLLQYCTSTTSDKAIATYRDLSQGTKLERVGLFFKCATSLPRNFKTK